MLERFLFTCCNALKNPFVRFYASQLVSKNRSRTLSTEKSLCIQPTLDNSRNITPACRSAPTSYCVSRIIEMSYRNTWCWVRASPIFFNQYMLRKRDLVAEVLVLQTSEGYFYYDNVSALIRNTGCDQLLAKKMDKTQKLTSA